MRYVPCRENKVMTTPPTSAARACLFPIGWTIGDGVTTNRADTIDDCHRVRPQPTGNSIRCLTFQFVNVFHDPRILSPAMRASFTSSCDESPTIRKGLIRSAFVAEIRVMAIRVFTA